MSSCSQQAADHPQLEFCSPLTCAMLASFFLTKLNRLLRHVILWLESATVQIWLQSDSSRLFFGTDLPPTGILSSECGLFRALPSYHWLKKGENMGHYFQMTFSNNTSNVLRLAVFIEHILFPYTLSNVFGQEKWTFQPAIRPRH